MQTSPQEIIHPAPRLVDRYEGLYGDWVETWEHTVTRACGRVETVLIDHYPGRSVDHGPRHLEQMESTACDTCLDMEEHGVDEVAQ